MFPMKENIINYINILHGYTTAIKNLHWSSSNMSEHKLCDDIADSIAENEDMIAEISQGIYGQIENNELKPIQYEVSSTSKMLSDLLEETEKFYETITDGKGYIGLKSVIENFLSDINKFQYLIKLCLKEDIKKRIQNHVNEERYLTVSHDELREMVNEAIKIIRINERTKNICDKYYSEPSLEDYYNGDDVRDRYDRQRLNKHHSTQKHKNNIKEAFSDVYQPHNFADPNKDYYEGFVIVDGTRAVLGHYDNYEEAVEDAKQLAKFNKYGTYEVYGCYKNEYALKEDYPEDNTLVYSTDENF